MHDFTNRVPFITESLRTVGSTWLLIIRHTDDWYVGYYARYFVFVTLYLRGCNLRGSERDNDLTWLFEQAKQMELTNH